MTITLTAPRLHLLVIASLVGIGITQQSHAAPIPVAKTLTPANATASESGAAVAMNDTYILVGAPSVGINNGAVDVYNAKTRAFVRRLVGSNSSEFGTALAIAGNTAYIGAPTQSAISYQGGAVYAFDIPTGKRLWVYDGDETLLALGEVLAVAGEYVAVGLPDSTGPRSFYSAGYVRLLDRKTGQYVGVIETPEPHSGDKCGISLAGSGSMLAVGVPFYDAIAADQGLVLLVDVSKPGFPYQMYYPGPSGQGYGKDVALADGYVAVAGSKHVRVCSLNNLDPSNPLVDIGNATANWHVEISGERVFASNSLTGGQILVHDLAQGSAPFTIPAPPPTQSNSTFGSAMAASQGTIVIGDGVVANSYVYDLPPISWAPGKMTTVMSANSAGVGSALQYAKFGAFSITAAGKVAVVTDLKGAGVTAANKQSVVSTITGFTGEVVRSGDAFGPLKIGSLGPAFVNATTRGLVMARFTGSNARVILEDQGSNVVEIVREGALINGGKKLLRLHEVVQPSMAGANDRATGSGAYQVGIAGVTSSSDSAIFNTGSLASFGELAREGNASPVAGTLYGQMMPRISRPGPFAAFCTTITGTNVTTVDNSIVVRHEISTATSKVIARKGSSAPYASGAKFNTFLRESACAEGNVVFHATLGGVPASTNEGIWTSDSTGNSIWLVARKGSPAIMLPPGVVFSRFLRVHQAANGDLGILTLVSGPGVNSSNDQCLYLHNETYGLALLAREGSLAPGANGARFGTFQNFDMAASEQYLLSSTLTQCASSTNLALFTGRAVPDSNVAKRYPVLQLRKGSQFARSGNPSLQSISFPRTSDTAGFSGKGLGTAVASGPCAFVLQFADGSSDLMSGTP